MPLDIGLNFRQTSTYVTDGAGETYVLGTDAYPTTRGGVTFGWESGFTSANALNRNASVDRRLAGVHFESGTAIPQFRLDLPAAGQYQIYAAFGDYGPSTTNYSEFRFLDDATVLFSSTVQSMGGAQRWTDATDVKRTSASDWSTNNAARTETFASTILRCRINYGGVDRTSSAVINHLRVIQLAAAASGNPWNYYAQLAG
jgi:hypothetical protein